MPETNLNQRIWTNESEEMKLKKQLRRSSLQTNLNKTRYAKSEKKSVSEVCRSPPRRPDGWRGPVGSQNDEARNQWHTGLIYSARVATWCKGNSVNGSQNRKIICELAGDTISPARTPSHSHYTLSTSSDANCSGKVGKQLWKSWANSSGKMALPANR